MSDCCCMYLFVRVVLSPVLCYALIMSITQTVEITASRRITVDVPQEIPLGRTVLTFTPVPAGSEHIQQSETRDIEIINQNAEELNREARDVLSYQDLFLDAFEA